MGNKEKKIAELKSKKKGDIIVAAVFQLFPLLSIFFIAVGVINRGDTVNTINYLPGIGLSARRSDCASAYFKCKEVQ